MDVWYFLYIAAMVGGVLLFWLWSRDPKGVPADEYAVAMIIPIWSGLAYFSMQSGLGVIEIGGREVFVARYADWVVTTPLLLYALTSTAYFYRPVRWTLYVGLVFATVIMILCGLLGDLAGGAPVQWVWFSLGVGALLTIFATLWGPMRRDAAAQSPELGAAYTKSAALFTALWVGYPTIWALGPPGLGVIGPGLTVPLLVVLPIISKVGFSIYDLFEVRKLGAKRAGYGFAGSAPVGGVAA